MSEHTDESPQGLIKRSSFGDPVVASLAGRADPQQVARVKRAVELIDAIRREETRPQP